MSAESGPRVCAAEGCEVVLSRFNRGDHCSLHVGREHPEDFTDFVTMVDGVAEVSSAWGVRYCELCEQEIAPDVWRYRGLCPDCRGLPPSLGVTYEACEDCGRSVSPSGLKSGLCRVCRAQPFPQGVAVDRVGVSA